MQVRYMLLQTHYKTPLNFTFAGLEGVKSSLHRLQDFITRLKSFQDGKSSGDVRPVFEKALKGFSEALADDLNISMALAAVFELVREVNVLADKNALSKTDAESVLSLLKRFNDVLGVLSFEDEQLKSQKRCKPSSRSASKRAKVAITSSLISYAIRSSTEAISLRIHQPARA